MTDKQVVIMVRALTDLISNGHADIIEWVRAATENIVTAANIPDADDIYHRLAADALWEAGKLMRRQADRLRNLADEFEIIAGDYE